MNRLARSKAVSPPRRVLILEGKRRHGALLHLGLHALGHDVRRTPHPVVALRAARSSPPDVFLVDFDVRGGAVAFCRALRDQGIAEPVLVVGQSNKVNDEVAALEGGADDYLPVPHDLLTLDVRVRTLPRRVRGDRGLRRIELDTANGSARVDGSVVALSDSLYSLLAALVAARGSVVSRSQLLSQLGHERQSIKMHICRLRAALGSAGDCIETVHGRGYRFVERPTGRGANGARRSR